VAFGNSGAMITFERVECDSYQKWTCMKCRPWRPIQCGRQIWPEQAGGIQGMRIWITEWWTQLQLVKLETRKCAEDWVSHKISVW
jgi:hypothetical protein